MIMQPSESQIVIILKQINSFVDQYENYMYYVGLVLSVIAIVWFLKFNKTLLQGKVKNNFYYITLGIFFNAIGLVALVQGNSKLFYDLHNVLMMIGLVFFVIAAKNLYSLLR